MASPIAGNRSEGVGLRHSVSRSYHYTLISMHSCSLSTTYDQSRSASGFSEGFAYLNVEIVVDLDRVPKQEDVLHQAGKLPHVAQLRQCRDVFRRSIWLGRCRRIEFGRGSVSLISRHRQG